MYVSPCSRPLILTLFVVQVVISSLANEGWNRLTIRQKGKLNGLPLNDINSNHFVLRQTAPLIGSSLGLQRPRLSTSRLFDSSYDHMYDKSKNPVTQAITKSKFKSKPSSDDDLLNYLLEESPPSKPKLGDAIKDVYQNISENLKTNLDNYKTVYSKVDPIRRLSQRSSRKNQVTKSAESDQSENDRTYQSPTRKRLIHEMSKEERDKNYAVMRLNEINEMKMKKNVVNTESKDADSPALQSIGKAKSNSAISKLPSRLKSDSDPFEDLLEVSSARKETSSSFTDYFDDDSSQKKSQKNKFNTNDLRRISKMGKNIASESSSMNKYSREKYISWKEKSRVKQGFAEIESNITAPIDLREILSTPNTLKSKIIERSDMESISIQQRKKVISPIFSTSKEIENVIEEDLETSKLINHIQSKNRSKDNPVLKDELSQALKEWPTPPLPAVESSEHDDDILGILPHIQEEEAVSEETKVQPAMFDTNEEANSILFEDQTPDLPASSIDNTSQSPIDYVISISPDESGIDCDAINVEEITSENISPIETEPESEIILDDVHPLTVSADDMIDESLSTSDQDILESNIEESFSEVLVSEEASVDSRESAYDLINPQTIDEVLEIPSVAIPIGIDSSHAPDASAMSADTFELLEESLNEISATEDIADDLAQDVQLRDIQVDAENQSTGAVIDSFNQVEDSNPNTSDQQNVEDDLEIFNSIENTVNIAISADLTNPYFSNFEFYRPTFEKESDIIIDPSANHDISTVTGYELPPENSADKNGVIALSDDGDSDRKRDDIVYYDKNTQQQDLSIERSSPWQRIIDSMKYETRKREPITDPVTSSFEDLEMEFEELRRSLLTRSIQPDSSIPRMRFIEEDYVYGYTWKEMRKYISMIRNELDDDSDSTSLTSLGDNDHPTLFRNNTLDPLAATENKEINSDIHSEVKLESIGTSDGLVFDQTVGAFLEPSFDDTFTKDYDETIKTDGIGNSNEVTDVIYDNFKTAITDILNKNGLSGNLSVHVPESYDDDTVQDNCIVIDTSVPQRNYDILKTSNDQLANDASLSLEPSFKNRTEETSVVSNQFVESLTVGVDSRSDISETKAMFAEFMMAVRAVLRNKDTNQSSSAEITFPSVIENVDTKSSALDDQESVTQLDDQVYSMNKMISDEYLEQEDSAVRYSDMDLASMTVNDVSTTTVKSISDNNIVLAEDIVYDDFKTAITDILNKNGLPENLSINIPESYDDVTVQENVTTFDKISNLERNDELQADQNEQLPHDLSFRQKLSFNNHTEDNISSTSDILVNSTKADELDSRSEISETKAMFSEFMMAVKAVLRNKDTNESSSVESLSPSSVAENIDTKSMELDDLESAIFENKVSSVSEISDEIVNPEDNDRIVRYSDMDLASMTSNDEAMTTTNITTDEAFEAIMPDGQEVIANDILDSDSPNEKSESSSLASYFSDNVNANKMTKVDKKGHVDFVDEVLLALRSETKPTATNKMDDIFLHDVEAAEVGNDIPKVSNRAVSEDDLRNLADKIFTVNQPVTPSSVLRRNFEEWQKLVQTLTVKADASDSLRDDKSIQFTTKPSTDSSLENAEETTIIQPRENGSIVAEVVSVIPAKEVESDGSLISLPTLNNLTETLTGDMELFVDAEMSILEEESELSSNSDIATAMKDEESSEADNEGIDSRIDNLLRSSDNSSSINSVEISETMNPNDDLSSKLQLNDNNAIESDKSLQNELIFTSSESVQSIPATPRRSYAPWQSWRKVFNQPVDAKDVSVSTSETLLNEVNVSLNSPLEESPTLPEAIIESSFNKAEDVLQMRDNGIKEDVTEGIDELNASVSDTITEEISESLIVDDEKGIMTANTMDKPAIDIELLNDLQPILNEFSDLDTKGNAEVSIRKQNYAPWQNWRKAFQQTGWTVSSRKEDYSTLNDTIISVSPSSDYGLILNDSLELSTSSIGSEKDHADVFEIKIDLNSRSDDEISPSLLTSSSQSDEEMLCNIIQSVIQIEDESIVPGVEFNGEATDNLIASKSITKQESIDSESVEENVVSVPTVPRRNYAPWQNWRQSFVKSVASSLNSLSGSMSSDLSNETEVESTTISEESLHVNDLRPLEDDLIYVAELYLKLQRDSNLVSLDEDSLPVDKSLSTDEPSTAHFIVADGSSYTACSGSSEMDTESLIAANMDVPGNKSSYSIDEVLPIEKSSPKAVDSSADRVSASNISELSDIHVDIKDDQSVKSIDGPTKIKTNNVSSDSIGSLDDNTLDNNLIVSNSLQTGSKSIESRNYAPWQSWRKLSTNSIDADKTTATNQLDITSNKASKITKSDQSNEEKPLVSLDTEKTNEITAQISIPKKNYAPWQNYRKKIMTQEKNPSISSPSEIDQQAMKTIGHTTSSATDEIRPKTSGSEDATRTKATVSFTSETSTNLKVNEVETTPKRNYAPWKNYPRKPVKTDEPSTIAATPVDAMSTPSNVKDINENKLSDLSKGPADLPSTGSNPVEVPAIPKRNYAPWQNYLRKSPAAAATKTTIESNKIEYKPENPKMSDKLKDDQLNSNIVSDDIDKKEQSPRNFTVEGILGVPVSAMKRNYAPWQNHLRRSPNNSGASYTPSYRNSELNAAKQDIYDDISIESSKDLMNDGVYMTPLGVIDLSPESKDIKKGPLNTTEESILWTDVEAQANPSSVIEISISRIASVASDLLDGVKNNIENIKQLLVRSDHPSTETNLESDNDNSSQNLVEVKEPPSTLAFHDIVMPSKADDDNGDFNSKGVSDVSAKASESSDSPSMTSHFEDDKSNGVEVAENSPNTLKNDRMTLYYDMMSSGVDISDSTASTVESITKSSEYREAPPETDDYDNDAIAMMLTKDSESVSDKIKVTAKVDKSFDEKSAKGVVSKTFASVQSLSDYAEPLDMETRTLPNLSQTDDLLLFLSKVIGNWHIEMYSSNLELKSAVDMFVLPDTSLLSKSETIAKGLRWRIISDGPDGYYLEYAIKMSNDETIYLFKGSLVGNRILGSVFSGLMDTDHDDAKELIDKHSYVISQNESWWHNSRPSLKKIGTFTMRRLNFNP